MKRIDKETGRKYNKKTRSSELPYPYIVVDDKNDVFTAYDLYRSVAMNKKGKWLDFAQYHIFRNNLIPDLPITEQLPLYLTGLSDGTKSEIVTKLSELDYNPLTDKIPVENLPVHLKNYFEKRKEMISTLHFALISTLVVEKNVLIMNTDTEFLDVEKEILFYLGVNVIIQQEAKNFKIFFNTPHKYFYEIKGKTINIKNIYSILKEFDTGWQIDKNLLYNNNCNETIENITEIIKLNIF